MVINMFNISRLWIFGKSKDVSCQSDAQDIDGGKPHVEKITQVLENHDLSTNDVNDLKETPPSFYYGVSLPPGVATTIEPLVVTKKDDVMKIVKHFKGARFKAFHKEEDAFRFASQAFPENSTPVTIGFDKMDYSCPPRHEIVQFRKSIENGNITHFVECVALNPRFLVTAVDTPLIMMEGYRYNALHVATKHKQPKICKLIIEAIEDPEFMEKLYPENSSNIRRDRTAYLVDLYMNMPDKKLSETPLHFACKFGCLECVRTLVSHPKCDKERKNKFGVKAIDMICERSDRSDSNLVKKIKEVFNETFFVPVLRSEDNSIQPVIGEPYSPEQSLLPNLRKVCSPCSPELTIMAKAGPMSPKQAQLFHKQWKTPPKSFGRLHIRLTDTDKGLERIGRELAQELKTNWTEYWPALNSWCNLSSPEGLKLFEEHLKSKSMNNMFQPSYSSSTDISHMENGSKFTICNNLMENLCNELAEINGAQVTGDKTCLNVVNHENSGSNHQPSYVTSNQVPSTEITSSESVPLHETPDVCSSNYPLRFRRSKFGAKSADSASNDSVAKFNLAVASHVESLKAADNKITDNSCLSKVGSRETGVFDLYESEIAKEMLAVIINCILNTDSPIDRYQKIHASFSEDVLPKIQCLLRVAKSINLQDCHLTHSNIAQRIYEEMKHQSVESEMKVTQRCLRTYLLKYNVQQVPTRPPSDDDEDEEMITKPHKKAGSYRTQIPSPWRKLKWQHLNCILKFLCVFIDQYDQKSTCSCCWEGKQSCDSQSKDDSSNLILAEPGDGDASTKVSVKLDFHCDDEVSDTDSNEYTTPPGSPLSSLSGSPDTDKVAPVKADEVYVEGQYPSKTDTDMFRAIEKVAIDHKLYPHIYRWKRLISSKDRETIESWASPAVERDRRYIKYQPNSPTVSSPMVPRNLFL